MSRAGVAGPAAAFGKTGSSRKAVKHCLVNGYSVRSAPAGTDMIWRSSYLDEVSTPVPSSDICGLDVSTFTGNLVVQASYMLNVADISHIISVMCGECSLSSQRHDDISLPIIDMFKWVQSNVGPAS